MAILGPKPWVNPFGKSSIFRHFKLLVFRAQKRVFSFQIIVKVIFLTNITIKKIGKMVIFGPKPSVNPFGKMPIFRILELLVFIAYKGAFSFQIIAKVIFLTNIALNKRLEKWPYLYQNHGKTSIFRHSELVVFIAKKGVFSFYNIVKVIFQAYIE